MAWKLYFTTLLLLTALQLFEALEDSSPINPDDEQIEQGEGDIDEGLYIASRMTSFYKQFEGLSDKERKAGFTKAVSEIDADQDTKITYDELHKWIWKNLEYEGSQMDLSQVNLMSMDKDNDGRISWEEFEEDFKTSVSHMHGDSMNTNHSSREILKEKIKFTYADKDRDGFLSSDELPRLVLPDNYLDMQNMFLDQQVVEFDSNGDGKVTQEEFIENSHDPSIIEGAVDHFEDYDEDKDGVLNVAEVKKSALETLPSSEVALETRQIMTIYDVNKDGVLSYDEMTNSYRYFTDKTMRLPEQVEDMSDKELNREEL